MSLISALDHLVAFVDACCAGPLRQRPPFDPEQFTILDRAACVEAYRLGLTDHLPRACYVNNPATFGHTNFPGSKGTMFDPPGWFQPMPSQIPRWRDQILSLRALAETRGTKNDDQALAGASENLSPPTALAFAMTVDDRCILTILLAHRPEALTIRAIIRESVRLNRDDPQKMRRLSESTIRKRIHVLESQHLVAKPPGTKKKGWAITDLGSQVVTLTAANSPQTQR
jgi:hypothetical protein